MRQRSLLRFGARFIGVTAALGGLFSAAGVEPLEQWEMILESRGEHFYELAAGPGENGRTYIVATTSKGSILTWPQDEPSAVTRITLPTVASTVAWANGRFVVGGSATYPILTSTNALEWAPVEGVPALDVAAGNGVFVAFSPPRLLRSTNGLEWAEVAMIDRFYSGRMYWSGRKFIIPSSASGVMLQSFDGLEWHSVKTEAFRYLYSMTYGEGRYLGINTAAGANVFVSNDAVAWRAVSTLEVRRPDGMTWGNGYFVAVGAGARAYSPDGISWKTVPTTETEYTVIFSNGRFISGGYGVIHQSGEVVSLAGVQDGGIQISGVKGKHYEVQSRDSLAEGAEWVAQGTFEMPEGGVYRWEDAAPVSSHRFYRVQQAGD